MRTHDGYICTAFAVDILRRRPFVNENYSRLKMCKTSAAVRVRSPTSALLECFLYCIYVDQNMVLRLLLNKGDRTESVRPHPATELSACFAMQMFTLAIHKTVPAKVAKPLKCNEISRLVRLLSPSVPPGIGSSIWRRLPYRTQTLLFPLRMFLQFRRLCEKAREVDDEGYEDAEGSGEASETSFTLSKTHMSGSGSGLCDMSNTKCRISHSPAPAPKRPKNRSYGWLQLHLLSRV
uniref:SOCS box domain-containing protein n=1 Tax=Steinernema glaseri TaxID=37863 RepID=A0A1I8AR77_9BILA